MDKLYLVTIICSLYKRPDHKIQLLNEAVTGLVMAATEAQAETRIRNELPQLANRNCYEIQIHSAVVMEQPQTFMSIRAFSPAFILSSRNNAYEIPAENKTEKTVLVRDDVGTICIIRVKNYDNKFADVLNTGNSAWHNSDNTWDTIVPKILRNAGYEIEILDYEDIEIT